jgi:release factor glutamine methyltransferase
VSTVSASSSAAPLVPSQVARRGAEYLSRHDVDEPEATAMLLLASVLRSDRTGIAVRRDPLTTAEAKAYGRALCRRCTGTPTQYLTGEQGFRRLVLTVRPGVFIPRPETEILVGETLAALASIEAPTVIDVGTGSGAIALALKDERPDARVVAVDRSPEAVGLARANAEELGLAIEVLEGDLFDPIPPALYGDVDAVVSNPPYVALERAAGLSTEVRSDPGEALFGGPGDHGRIAEAAAAILRPGGILAMEIGDDQADSVIALVSDAGYTDLRLSRDLNDRDRVVVARKP